MCGESGDLCMIATGTSATHLPHLLHLLHLLPLSFTGTPKKTKLAGRLLRFGEYLRRREGKGFQCVIVAHQNVHFLSTYLHLGI
jgi:hypothetical protein